MATTDKYDRQLRLWGAHGQRQLGTGKCICLGTSSAGTETLKNLVLPGFGHITIVDDKSVEERDLGNDFFVTANSIGQPKAQVILDLLLEMNPEDVQGEALVKSVSSFISEQQVKIKEAQLIIACDVDDATALALDDLCAPSNIPLLILRQYGMVGYLRVSKPVNCIVEPKMAQVNFKDLRVSEPWPQLTEFAASFDMDSLEQMKFIHVPYAVVLIKACDKWRAAHNGEMPKKFAEKQEFKAMIKGMNRFVVAENFDEAIVAAQECFKTNAVLPDNISNLFTEFSDQLESPKTQFWVMAKALKMFATENGKLPVQGTIPDMISITEYYVKLQQIYLEQSSRDQAILMGKIEQILREVNASGEVVAPISDEALTMFVRGCHQINVLKMNTIRQEFETPDWSADVVDEIMDPSCTSVRWLLAMKAFEKAAAASANPTTFSDDQAKQAEELAAMKAEAKRMTDSMEQEELDERYLKELQRYGRSKLHCVSSFLGGVAAQEAVKLVMNQYLPINHTFIFDGVSGTGQVFNL